jgi:hypothetical protein
MEALIFMFCLTLHNIEEALWFNEWKIKTLSNNGKSSKNEHFVFALIGITIMGYLISGLYALFPTIQYFGYIFIGFVGAMIINAIMPHLALTIKYKKYCPGVLTGCFLMLPLGTIIIWNAVNNHFDMGMIIISIFAVGTILICAIPLLFILAKKFLST